MTSNVFTKHKHIGLRSNRKGMVNLNLHKVRCLILMNRVHQGKNSAMVLVVTSYSQKELELFHKGCKDVLVFFFCLLGRCCN